MPRQISLTAPGVTEPIVYGGTAYTARDEDGDYVTRNRLLGISVDGADYRHPHSFRNNDKYGADTLAARMIAKGVIDLDLWIEPPPPPTSEERAAEAWRLEQEDRRQWGACWQGRRLRTGKTGAHGLNKRTSRRNGIPRERGSDLSRPTAGFSMKPADLPLMTRRS